MDGTHQNPGSHAGAKSRKRKPPVKPKRYGFRLCRRPHDLGTVIVEKPCEGGGKEFTCWTRHGWRTYRAFPSKRGEVWLVWSGFDT